MSGTNVPGAVAKERRRERRLELSFPVRVSGHAADGSTWTEMTRSEELCFGGASFPLKTPVSQGTVLQLSLALPQRFRQFDFAEPAYRVYCVVRNVGSPKAEGARVGVMFLGKHAPAGYDQGVRLLMPNDQLKPRQHPRYDVRVGVKLRRLDTTAGSSEERTLTEDLGLGGALVLTTLAIAKGESVSLETEDGLLKARCSVQNVTIGPDNVPRLSLMFADDDAAGAVRAVLRRNGFQPPEPAGPPPEAAKPLPQPAAQPISVRFERHEAFPECAQSKHGACTGWSWDSPSRALRLCRCLCHGA
jgi:hypothetical protein